MIRRLNAPSALELRGTSAPPILPSTSTTVRPRDVMRIESLLNSVDDESGARTSKAHYDAATALLELSSGSSEPANPPPSASPFLITASDSPTTSMRAQLPGGGTPSSPLLHHPVGHDTNLPYTVSEARDSSSEFNPSPTPLGDDLPLSPTRAESLTLDHDDELLHAQGDVLSPSDDATNGDHETAGDPHNREFTCWVRQDGCATGQYTLDLSRKMVSDYFGRNKAGTRKVQEHRWIRACRKHYQRKSYQDQWRWHKGFVVIQQLRLIAEQQPSPPLLFKVSLKSSEEKRLDKYKGALFDQNRLFDPTADEVTRIDPDQPDQAPIAVLQEIKEFVRQHGDAQECLGLEDCVDLVRRAIDVVKTDRCRRLPLFEMMPMFADEGKDAGKAKMTPSPKKGAAGKKRKSAGGSVGGGSAAKRAKA